MLGFRFSKSLQIGPVPIFPFENSINFERQVRRQVGNTTSLAISWWFGGGALDNILIQYLTSTYEGDQRNYIDIFCILFLLSKEHTSHYTDLNKAT